MLITGFSVQQCFRHIPLRGWASVENALQAYAAGLSRGAHAAEDKQIRAIGEKHGGVGVALYQIAAMKIGQPDQMVERMLAKAQATLAMRYHWSHSFDHDGMGTPFFKASVEIEVLDRQAELYALGIHAAYVGDEPERQLAEYLGIPRALTWSAVTVEVEPADAEHFAFDFEQLARQLDPVLGSGAITGETIAHSMLSKNDWGDSCPDFVLYQYSNLVVRVRPERVKQRFDWKDPFGPAREQIDTWSVTGAVLSGLLDESFTDRSKKETPSFCISVAYENGPGQNSRYRSVCNQKEKDQVIGLTGKIAKALD